MRSTTSGGVTYTVVQARLHETELYAFTDSWRITDRADSLLSQDYDGFDDANPPHSIAAIARRPGLICSGR